MTTVALASIVAAVVLVGTVLTTRAVLHFLERRRILDTPNERSSHATPTPRGLGLGVIPVVIASWLVLGRILPSPPRELWLVCTGAFVLSAVSWLDDVQGLPIRVRILVQAFFVVAGMWLFDAPPVFHQAWLPPLLDRFIACFLWLGLINHVNFADGIDGHLGTKVASIGGGLFLVAITVGGAFLTTASLALSLAAAALGFLRLNWHPARGFMGDVGSVPIGYLLGWLLLRTASYGQWAPALILPLFYFVDTAVTYVRRVPRVRKFWLPHREYLYQRATARFSHARIEQVVFACNIALIALALVAAQGFRWSALALSPVPVGSAYFFLAQAAKKGPGPQRSLGGS